MLLFIAETLGAAGLLIALGMAAAVTGIITALFGVSWEWQLSYFSIFCIVFAIGWWRWLKTRAAEYPTSINRPFDNMKGQVVTLVEPIEDGKGKVKINDALWFVQGPDLPVGSKVKIVSIRGTVMIVEPVLEIS